MALIRSLGIDRQAAGLSGGALAEARADLEQRLAAEFERGRAAGLEACRTELEEARARVAASDTAIAAARDDLEQRWAAGLAAVAAAAAALRELRDASLVDAEQDCLTLALAVAARVLRREVSSDPSWLIAVCQELRAALPPAPDARIHLHAADLADLRERCPEDLVGLPELVAEPALARGSCRGESGGTRIDAGVATAWERLAERLLTPREGDA